MRLAEYTGSPVEDLYGPAPDFDVRDYARTAVGNLREGLNIDAYTSAPLGADTLRTLSFLQAVERSTMQHLRTVLVTPTHKDARVTAFLTTWAFEKYWIADALSAILSVHATVPIARKRNVVSRFFREIAERFAPIKESLVANQIGVEMIAVHMTIGAIDGWLTQAAYSRLAQLDKNTELDDTIERILEIKARHLTFFEPQAEFRLSASARAQKLTRKRLRRETWPIGAADLAPSSSKDFYSRLFASEPGLAHSIDNAIDGLPGLSGLGLIEKASA
jgi:hypothetical protein